LVTSDGRLIKLNEEGQVKELLLEGVMYDKTGLSYVLVNGEALTVGDRVNGYQILKIEKEKVVFIKEGEITEIELKKEEP
jgi:uncharacterized beta-barrel protein YwiB (DUF1934 family)